MTARTAVPIGSSATERITRLLEPAYSEGLPARSDADLRAMKAECVGYETSLSFYRRLAQARIEILEAEQDRRSRGGSLTDLIDRLPEILAERGRSSPTQSRVADVEIPEVELHWPDQREHVVTDDTLTNLVGLDDATLAGTLESLRSFERDVSDLRRGLHGVIDAIEHEIATRQAAGTAG